ncbi:MAG: Bacteriophage holin family [Bacteroidota bacterium]|jgi:phage-related holin|nr:Bacteriophage holin family [Bacteroidota bacterium]
MKSFLYKYSAKLFLYITVVFTPILSTLLWLGVFIACDLVTGIIKARKTSKPITSRAMSQTATKTLLYFLLVICSHILDTQFLNVDFLPVKITQLAAGFLAVTEFKSVAENMGEILGMPIWEFLKNKMYRKDA